MPVSISALFAAVYIDLPENSRHSGTENERIGIISGMSRFKLNKTVVMIGMIGAGKTAVGTVLARSLGVKFVDSDHELEAASNTTIAEIFDNFGEEFFRKKESQVLARLLEEEPCVLSTGGGAFLRAANRDIIAQKGLAIWLKADEDLLWARVKHKSTRPLLRVPNPREKLCAMLRDREPFYQMAGLTVEADPNYTVQDMANKVIDVLLADSSNVLNEAR